MAMGIMMGCPHLLHGMVASGGMSPGMKARPSHPLQVTIFSGVSLMAVAIYHSNGW
jgi:hypothetical protein